MIFKNSLYAGERNILKKSDHQPLLEDRWLQEMTADSEVRAKQEPEVVSYTVDWCVRQRHTTDPENIHYNTTTNTEIIHYNTTTDHEIIHYNTTTDPEHSEL